MYRRTEHCPACQVGFKRRLARRCPRCKVQLVRRGERWDVTEPAWLGSSDHTSWVYQAPEAEAGVEGDG